MIGGDRLTGRRGLDKVASEVEQAGRDFRRFFGLMGIVFCGIVRHAGTSFPVLDRLYNHC